MCESLHLQVELQVLAVHVVSRAAGALPFELVDAARSEVRGRSQPLQDGLQDACSSRLVAGVRPFTGLNTACHVAGA